MLLPRLKGGASHVNTMTEHVERMAVESGLSTSLLRHHSPVLIGFLGTLVIGARDLSQQQFDAWQRKWEDAAKLTEEEEKQRRQNELADEVER